MVSCWGSQPSQEMRDASLKPLMPPPKPHPTLTMSGGGLTRQPQLLHAACMQHNPPHAHTQAPCTSTSIYHPAGCRVQVAGIAEHTTQQQE